MTRCYKSSSTLKSSVFNQTGQTFIDQIEVQRTLCAHFRRILSAKSVVDSRNPKYMKMIHRKTRPTTAKKFLLKCPSDETIEKLAYDTEHHPCDLVRVQCRSKSTSHDRSWSGDRQRPINNDANYPRPKAHTSRERSSTGKLNGKNQKRPATTSRSQQQSKDKRGSMTCRSTRSKGCKYDEASEQRSDGGELQEGSHWRFEEQCCQGEEEARYARFVYDITQEIVQNGLYTDCELKEVFEKHLRKNSGHLNRRKMLYEIYQLKISLNMMDDTEDEDEVETDLVFAEKFSTHRVPKPPTPPKILNENKMMEKLESFKQFECCRNLDTLANAMPISTPCRKSVTLVDANPEFLVTERDVLSTLADNHVEPYQIERICRNLYQKSKDMSLCEAVQVGSEVAYTYRLKQVDRCTSAASLSDICYSKKESRGILRKECGTASKSLSPMSFRKFSFAKVKGYDGQEKCARWAIGECDCEEQPCHQHREPTERLRKSIKIEDSSASTPGEVSKAQQAGSTKCDCNCESKRHHTANAETSPRQQKRSSLKKNTEKYAYCNDYIKSEIFVDGVCDCNASPCSEHTVPPLRLNRRSEISVPNEEEKWKQEDSSELTHAKKEGAQRMPRKSSKCSDEEKNQSQKSSKTSNQENDQSRKSSKSSERVKIQSRKSSKLSEQEKDQSPQSNKLSEKEKEQSQKSNKLSEKEKGESQKSSKLSGEHKKHRGKPNKWTEQEIVKKTPAVEQKSPKGGKLRSSKSAAVRRSSSESSLSDMQPEVWKASKTRKQKANFGAPQIPVIMRSRLPSVNLKNGERISTESSEISSESDEPTASAIPIRRSSKLSAIASKSSVEASEYLRSNEGDGEENRSTRSPPMRSRKVSVTTSADTSNRTSGEFDIEYTKYARRSTAESQKDSEAYSETAPQAPQERKKDVPKDRMRSKVPLVSKSNSEISEQFDSNSNKKTLSERERPASSALGRVLINVLDSPKSSRISEILALSNKPLQEDVLMEKLERIQSTGDENNSKEKDAIENQPRTSIMHKRFSGVVKSEKPNGDSKLSFNVIKSPKYSTDSKRSLLARHFRNRKSSVLFQSGIKSPKKRDNSQNHNQALLLRKSVHSSTSRSRQSSSAIDKIPKEKQASSGNEESSENEEIEEEIETASETTARSLRERMKKAADREVDKKRQMMGREAAKALEEERKGEEEDEEERYSDDFSDVSDSSRRSEEASKVQQRFMPSMRDFLEKIAQMNEPKAPYVTSGSSDSDCPSMLSLNVPSGSLDETALSTPVIKKRTSSGLSGYKVMETWNERLSELSRDFYVNPVARYCDPRCRSSLIAKICSENCKYAKTNCSHIKEPTDCMKSDEDNSDASTQESSF